MPILNYDLIPRGHFSAGKGIAIEVPMDGFLLK